MKIKWNAKYNTISVYTVLTFAACLIVYTVIFNFTVLGDAIKSLFTVLAPIVWGLVIAYILNPIMMWIELRIRGITERKKPLPKLTRTISLLVTMILFLATAAALCSIILPQVIDSIMGIFNNIGAYINNFEKWIDGVLERYPKLLTIVNDQIQNIEDALMEFVNNIVPKIGDIMLKLTDSTMSLIVSIKDVLIGMIVAVYLLFDKEHFQAQLKKIVNAILPKRAARGFMRVCAQTNASISGFMSGKIIDSIIIGMLCFICMSIMKLDFAVLISVIVTVTNVIPFFGPFIGAIPSAILLLVSTPKQVIPFLILIFIIQQLDGNVIGPKILGQSIGISSFWVLFSILVGGGLFGFAGMILGVPIFAVIYSLINEYISYLLEKKKLSTVTDDYRPDPPILITKKKKPKTKIEKSESSDESEDKSDI